MNNFEKIKQMSIEEMAEMLAEFITKIIIFIEPLSGLDKERVYNGNLGILKQWLQAESEG